MGWNWRNGRRLCGIEMEFGCVSRCVGVVDEAGRLVARDGTCVGLGSFSVALRRECGVFETRVVCNA